jgi:PE family
VSFLTVQPEALVSAAADLDGLGYVLRSGNALAAAPTAGVTPAAADVVSALTAAQFAAHAGGYQAVAARAAAIHDLLVTTLRVGSGSYHATEAANAAAAG